jgi:sporulation protein YlmC with PRC-barrel domain
MTAEGTHDLVSANLVAGTFVFNREGEKLGSIEDLILEKETGQVAYVLLSFGGFLGMGERCFPVPWRALSFDDARDAYVVDLTRESLEKAPRCRANACEPLRDHARHQEIYTYYGVSPLW